MKESRPINRLGRALIGTAAAAALSGFATGAFALTALDDQPVTAIGAMAFNRYDLSGGGAVAYRGDYLRSTWDGDLVAYDVAASGNATVKWQARKQLAAANWNTGRKIFTANASGTGAPFRWSGSPSLGDAQRAALGDATEGPRILDYLRGDASNEYTASNPGGLYRQRHSRIGAVIRSRPYWYEHGRDAGGQPIARVYVGANDGMLHAFDAATGNEVFAYVPSMLFGKLKDLSVSSSTAYKPYVDGLLAVAPVPTAGGRMTLLAGGLGAGARGLYALDVSNPSPASETEAAAMARFEISDTTAGFGNIGYVHAAPQIVKLNDGRTALLVANGVASATGVSSLFVIDALSGARLAEIAAGSGPDNGLGGLAAVDRDGNGTVDVVYAGDLKGTLWKFDLSASGLPSSATALFTPAAGTARPITVAPSVMQHPLGGLFINFGTGQAYEPADLTHTGAEYVYGIWDSPRATATSLVTPTLATESVTVASVTTPYRVASASTVNYGAGARGWRVALGNGERVIGGDTLTDSGRYVITTSIPNSGSTQGAWLLQLDALTGGRPSQPFFDVNGDGQISRQDDSDRIRVGATSTLVAPSGRFLGAGAWSQPVLVKINSTVDRPYFNFNGNTVLTATQTQFKPPAGESGVYGGHFDFDIYFNVCNALSGDYDCPTNNHTHQYDDKWDVVGVNMLNASDPAFNLVNAIPGTSASFKILVTNVNWSPAARLKVVRDNGDGTTVTIDTSVWQLPLSPEGFLAATQGGAALTFTRANLKTFTYRLAVTGFGAKEWRPGSGDTRAGLIPTQTGCVRGNKGGQGANPTGPWMNGALTFQVVSAAAAAADVQPTLPADAGGYRLKSTAAAQALQLAQYTTFWHHKNGKCYGDPGWQKGPVTHAGGDKASTRPPGTDDPLGGAQNGDAVDDGQPPTGTSTVRLYNGVEVIVTLTFTDAGVTQEIRRKSDNVILDTSVSAFGSIIRAAVQLGNRPRLGRLAWKELVR